MTRALAYARSILATNNDLLNGLRKGLGVRRSLIVQTAGYDPNATDVESDVARLKASGANTFAIFAFGKFATQATHGHWVPFGGVQSAAP